MPVLILRSVVNDDEDSPAVRDDIGGANEEQLLRVSHLKDPVFTWTPNINYTNYLTYKSTGLINNIGRFTYCDERGAPEARAIFINTGGRPRLSTDSDDDGTHDDSAVTPTNLTCP